MALNVTTAVFAENCNTATASPSLAQWDTEQVLQISGIELPDSYKVEFSTVYTRNAIPEIGDASGVTIPNVLLQRSAPITAYVVLYGENGGRNREYWITIYITPGQPPETITPDPEQADVIDQAIAALNNGVARTEAAATSAEGSARDAEAAAEAVQNLSVAAETLATGEPATVEKAVDEETGAVTLNFGLPRGVKGDPLTYEDLTPEQKAELVQGPILEAQDAAVTAVGNARASAVDAVESAGTTQVNAVNQAGTTQTGTVNQAGANQVAAVNQAGTNQVQAVEDKGAEVLDSIPQDYSDLADDVADLSRQLSDKQNAPATAGTAGQVLSLDDQLNPVWADQTGGGGDVSNCAPIIINTASGDIATFTDGADNRPIRKIVGTIVPVQEGTGDPSPDNVRPISGWTGAVITKTKRNLFDKSGEWIPGGREPKRLYLKLPIPDNVLVKMRYVTKTNDPDPTGYFGWSYNSYDANEGVNWAYGSNWGSDARSYKNITTAGTNRDKYCVWLTAISGNTQEETRAFLTQFLNKYDIEIYYEAQETSGAVGEYGMQIIPINWQPEVGTIYGGTVTVNEDGSADVISTYGIKPIADWNFYIIKNQNPVTGWDSFQLYLPATDISVTGTAIVDGKPNIWSSEFVAVENALTNPDYSIRKASNYIYLAVPENTYANWDEFKTALADVPIVYPLATPQTYHFSNVGQLYTFLGTNNIWIDTGAITECDYPADTKLYIDGKIAELQALVLENNG